MRTVMKCYAFISVD